MNKCILFLFLMFAPLIAEEEIRVELSTEQKLTPFYLSKWQTSGTLSATYVQQLRAILQFDLQHSGYLAPLATDQQIESAISASDPSSAFQAQNCGSAHHLIKGVVDDKKLNLFVFSTKSKSLKEFQNIQLSGDLGKDRRQIHKLSDAIIKLLFNAQGIASTRLLYSMQLNPNDQKWRAEIWECDWDGANARQVTQEDSYSITPVFIPGKDSFLYVSYKNGLPKIYLSLQKSRTGKRLLDLRGNQLLPAVSPKRDKIAFICDATGRADLFVQSIDISGTMQGKPVQLFSLPGSTQGSPTFSADGSKVAFVSDKDGSARIYQIPATGGSKRAQPELITKANRENTCPSWSPDGTKLAYSAKTNGIRQIWIYDFATSEEKQLTSGPGNKENPVWAPDSLHIIFNSTDPSSSELYIVNLNQPEAVKISQGPGKKHYPTWGT